VAPTKTPFGAALRFVARLAANQRLMVAHRWRTRSDCSAMSHVSTSGDPTCRAPCRAEMPGVQGSRWKYWGILRNRRNTKAARPGNLGRVNL